MLAVAEITAKGQAKIPQEVRAALHVVPGDPMLLLALTRAVEIVGKAAAQVSEAGRGELPAVPWPQIIGMRNRLIHAYFDINRNILWDTVLLALPTLLQQLRATPGKE